MLVRHHRRLTVLQLRQERAQLLIRRQPNPQRQRVDEQPHHALNAGELRRTARDRDAEHHVIASGQPAQQDRPRRLNIGVERQSAAARLLVQCRGQCWAQRQRHPLGRQRRTPHRIGRKPGWLFEPRQCLAPGRKRRTPVLRRNPAQIIAIARHRRQRSAVAPAGIERQQFADQHRGRPAVHQDVVAGEEKTVLIRRKPDQREADQRRGREIEMLGAFLRRDLLEPLAALCGIQRRQIEAAPRQLWRRHDDLHRAAQVLVLETGAQAGMALQQRLHGALERRLIEPPLQVQLQLRRVDVRSPRRIQRMKQKSFLQRR